MKYCVSARVGSSTRNKADEIYIANRDKNILIDYIEKYPNKTLTLELLEPTEIDIELFKAYNEKLTGGLQLSIPSFWDDATIQNLKENGIKFFFRDLITDFAGLRHAVRRGASAIVIGVPLTHRLMDIKRAYNIPVRTSPNLLYTNSVVSADDRVCFNWIRPEDVKLYEEYIDTLEMFGENSFAETSLKIYKEDGKWEDRLYFLVPGLDPAIDNRVLNKAGEARLNCGLRCMEGGTCRLCRRFAGLSKTMHKLARENKDN